MCALALNALSWLTINALIDTRVHMLTARRSISRRDWCDETRPGMSHAFGLSNLSVALRTQS